ncbi:MAG TPA: glycosyltransferase family 9 protein [Chthoniobacterales bacterium]|nr:glycosyltransferase family 9 protein [Chthoniobacterales bacterium]
MVRKLKILLIQLRRLGDLILTTPAILAVREHFPGAQIALAVSRECESLLPAIPGLQKTFLTKRGFRDLPTWMQIRRAGFDCVIDFTRNDRSAWLTVLSAAPRRIVSERLKTKSKLRARFYNEFVDCAMKQMHTVDYGLALLRPLGISGPADDPVLDLPRAAKDRASSLISDQIRQQPFAVFHPGSARAEKFWDPDRWSHIIKFAAIELGLVPVLSGGANHLERTQLAAIREKLQTPVLDLSGQLDLLVLAALLEHARLLVTVDSAPMHLASATGTPQVALFGPTNPFHWRPRNSPAAILLGDSQEPLRHFQVPQPKKPMNQISTGAVIDAMRSMLSAPAASAV